MNPMPSNQVELRDIHLPDPVSWWPLASGWWMLLLLTITLITISYYFIPKIIRKLKHKPARKLALSEFNEIKYRYNSQKDNLLLIQSISILLRRICMTYDTRNTSAGLTGKAWLDKINTINSKTPFSDDLLSIINTAPYKENYEFNPDEILEKCEEWITHLPKEAQR